MGVSIVMEVPPNGWVFVREHPIKMNDLGVPPFQEPPVELYGNYMGIIWDYFFYWILIFSYIHYEDCVL